MIPKEEMEALDTPAENKDIVKISWSGGKDSTAAMLLHLEAGHKVKAVCYIPMFTKDIPLIVKEHYNFILRTKQFFESKGAEVHIITGETYYDHVTRIISRGKNKGKIFGFPCFLRGKCAFSRDSKIKALDHYDIGEYDYKDIGIAYDEDQRKNQLSEFKRSILNEMKYTEEDAKNLCLKYNVLSPLYEWRTRDGCALCPNARERERERWFTDYPEAIPILKELQDRVKKERPEHPPLRGCKYFIED